jgi:cupin 2 domain-containing protein
MKPKILIDCDDMTKIANIFEGSFGKMPGEIFDEIVSGENVRIERIVSKGHASPENFWYDQEHNEWVAVLKGEAVLRFADEAEPVRMKAGDHVEIPAHRKHRVEWTDPDRETVWLAVHY